MTIRELTLLVSGKRLQGPLTNGHVIRPMARHWPMAWYYWPNNPLAVGVEQPRSQSAAIAKVGCRELS
jgi:hypothetical protein